MSGKMIDNESARVLPEDKQVTNKKTAGKSPLSRLQAMNLLAKQRFKEIVGSTALQYTIVENNLKYGRYHYRLATMDRLCRKKRPSQVERRLRFLRLRTSLAFTPRPRQGTARDRPQYTHIGRFNRARIKQLALRPRKSLERNRSKGA